MNLTLSWDLVIIVFFAVIITYTFIIGRKESIKIIIASYIAIVAVQGVGNGLQRLMNGSATLLGPIGFNMDLTILSTTKLVLFIAIIIFLTVRAVFEIVYTQEPSLLMNGVYTGLFGFATAGLLLSTLLTYVAGVPLLDANLQYSSAVSPIIQQSQLMQLMIVNQDLWFCFPAILLMVVGFLSNK